MIVCMTVMRMRLMSLAYLRFGYILSLSKQLSTPTFQLTLQKCLGKNPQATFQKETDPKGRCKKQIKCQLAAQRREVTPV